MGMHIPLPLFSAMLLLQVILGQSRAARAEETYVRAARRGLEPISPPAESYLRHGRDTEHLGERIVRFNTTFRGLPVFFRRPTAQVDRQQCIRRITRRIEGFEFSGDHPLPDKKQVLTWVNSLDFKNAVVSGNGWLARRDGGLTPVARAEVPEDGKLEPVALFFHGETGRIVHTEPLRRTQESPFPFGAVYLENPVTTPEVSVVPLEYLNEEAQHLHGAFAHVDSCVDLAGCTTIAPAALRSEVPGAEFVFAPHLEYQEDPDPFAEVNAYRNVSAINRWMRESFGFSEDFGDHPWMWVKVGRVWDNAGYYQATEESDPFLLFGRGTDADPVNFAYDADTAYHEFAHAVLDRLWSHPWMARDRYGVDVAMGAIEEALADTVALTFSGDPTLNGYVVRSRSGINDEHCPESLVSEGHFEAEFLTAFGWSVFEDIGPPFAHILYRTLHFLEPEMGFRDLVTAMEQSVKDLVAEGYPGVSLSHLDVIREQAEERGLMDEDCLNRLVPMPAVGRRLAVGYGNRRTNGVDFPFGLQWQIEIPEGKRAFKLFLEWYYPLEDEDGNPVTPGYRVHIRRGAPVEVIWLDEAEPGEPAFEVTADRTVDGSPAAVGYPTLDLPPAEEGEVFYVLLSADHPEPVIAVVGELRFMEGQTELPPIDDDIDAAPAETFTPATGGSSCSVTAPAASFGISLLRLMSALI